MEETIEEEERVPTNDEGGTSRRERRACGSASMSLRIALVAQLTSCSSDERVERRTLHRPRARRRKFSQVERAASGDHSLFCHLC